MFAIDVACSPGTYIRTLAADLGHLLGGGAHLRNLRRTAVGEFTLDEAGPPDDCELLPVDTAVRELDRVVDVDDDVAGAGRQRPGAAARSTASRAVGGVRPRRRPAGRLRAVPRPAEAKPAVVLPTG